MSDTQFFILFFMALVFIVANDYIAFLMWYVLYSESLTVVDMPWDVWTIIFMIWYIIIKLLATRFGWGSKSQILGGDK